jgi:hypothetical protein
VESRLIALSAQGTLCAFNFQLSTARATRLTLRLPLLLLLALPAVAQAQLPFITQDAIPITGYASLAYGDAVTIPGTAKGHRVTSIEFQGFDNGLHDLLYHYRIRTRSRFKRNFQSDFAVACNDQNPLNSSGIVVARCDAAQPVICFNGATARGPPGSDNTLPHPAPHFCTAPLLSEFQSHAFSLARNATHPLIHSSLVSRAGTLLVAGGFSSKYNQTIKQKELL